MISKEQVEIVGMAVEKVTRTTSHPMIAELGGILTHRCGYHNDIVEEDNSEEDIMEEDNIEEDKLIEEVLTSVYEVFETSDNFLATPDKDKNDESVQLTPPSSIYDRKQEQHHGGGQDRLHQAELHHHHQPHRGGHFQ